MPNSSPSPPLSGHLIKVPLGDRWQVYRRLQELMIPCDCLSDGSLRVEVDHCLAALLVHSTVQQFTATRQELVDRLERCWFAF